MMSWLSFWLLIYRINRTELTHQSELNAVLLWESAIRSWVIHCQSCVQQWHPSISFHGFYCANLPVLENDIGILAILNNDKYDDRNLPAASGKINIKRHFLVYNASVFSCVPHRNGATRILSKSAWNMAIEIGYGNSSSNNLPTMFVPELLAYHAPHRTMM